MRKGSLCFNSLKSFVAYLYPWAESGVCTDTAEIQAQADMVIGMLKGSRGKELELALSLVY